MSLPYNVATTSAAYATFLSNLQNPKFIINHNATDANNGTFTTSLAKVRYVYNPTGDTTGELFFELLEVKGGYVFASATDLQNHVNTALAG